MENMSSIDNRALKMWMSRTPDSDIGPDNNGKLLWEDAVNSEDIFEFCDQANAVSLAGHNDWRVPNMNELLQLIDWGANNPSINTTAFPSTPANHFWTSTTRSDDATHAFRVSFYYGYIGSSAKATGKYYVRLVRDV